MTIDKSKGLEFDTVILPGLDKSTGSDKKPLLQWREQLYQDRSTGLAICPLDKSGNESDLYRFLHKEHKRALEFESTRLLYVAATRAKEHLHLVAVLSAPEEGGDLKAPGKASLLHKIWPYIEQDANYPVPAALADAVSLAKFNSYPLKRLAANWSVLPGLPARIQDHNHSDDYPLVEETKVEDDSSLEIACGLLLHEILELVSATELDDWTETRLAGLTNHWRIRLSELGAAEEELETGVSLVKLGVSQMLADEQGRWILSPIHRGAHAEWQLSSLTEDGNSISRHIIDRCFEHDGEYWVIDYKLSQKGAEEGQAAFLQRQQQYYHGQLQRYKELLQSISVKPVRCALYFPLQQYFHEIIYE
jgi:ATP-dependent exoDNAse (exonuclease V) beta subunit